jgi:hypothetical protein
MGIWRLPGMCLYFYLIEPPVIIKILTGVFIPSEGFVVCMAFMLQTKFFQKIHAKRLGKPVSSSIASGSQSQNKFPTTTSTGTLTESSSGKTLVNQTGQNMMEYLSKREEEKSNTITLFPLDFELSLELESSPNANYKPLSLEASQQ